MAEDCSFVAPGHVPTRWHRSPGHPHNSQGFHHSQPNQRHPQTYQAHQNNTWTCQNNGQGYPNTPQPYHQNTQGYQNKAQAYQHTYNCGPCNRTFHSQYQLEKHLQEHVKCPFPECHMTAHPKAIERHIDNQHLLVNFANLQIDDEAWIAERKRKFPTSQRAELRRAQQLEKTKRGERLGKSAKPFASRGDRGRGRGRGSGRGRGGGRGGGDGGRSRGDGGRGRGDRGRGRDGGGRGRGDTGDGVKNEHKRPGDSEWTDQRGRKKRRMMNDDRKDKVAREENEDGERNFKPTSFRPEKKAPQRQRSGMPSTVTVPDPDSDDEDARDGIPAFRGTRHFYESTGEISYFGIKSGTVPECHMEEEEQEVKEGKQTEVVISDEEDWNENGLQEVSVSGSKVQPTTLVLGGALGSLMGAYSDSEEDNDLPESTTLQEGRQCGTQNQSQNTSTKEVEQDKNKKESNGINAPAAKSTTTTTTTTTAATPTPATTKTPRHWKKKRHPKNGFRKGPKPAGGVRSSFPKRRKTLLERLLLPDITRERNIILQCIRYIVQNEFFQIQSNEEGKEIEERGTEKREEEQRGENMNRKVEEKIEERNEDMEAQSQKEKEADEEGKEKMEVECEKQENDDKERKETEEEKVHKSIRSKEEVKVEMRCEKDKQEQEKVRHQDRTKEEEN